MAIDQDIHFPESIGLLADNPQQFDELIEEIKDLAGGYTAELTAC